MWRADRPDRSQFHIYGSPAVFVKSHLFTVAMQGKVSELMFASSVRNLSNSEFVSPGGSLPAPSISQEPLCESFSRLTMSDRAFLFLFSLIVLAGVLALDSWLIVSGQLGTIDGLFLFCSSLVIAFAFGLYVRFLVRSAMPQALSRETRVATQQAQRKSTANAGTTLAVPEVR